MDLKQNPFSLYDFLGYFTPGGIFLYATIAAYGHAKSNTDVLGYLSTSLSFEKPELYVPFVLMAYVTGHFLSFVSSITVERYSIWALGYPSKYLLGRSPPGYYSIEEKPCIRRALRTLVAVLLLPVVLLDLLLGVWMGMRDLYAKKLDALLVAALNKKIQRLIGEHAEIDDPVQYGEASEHDFFRYAYHYAVENAPNHLPKMQNYVALYGFLRTLTLLSAILFWFLVWHTGQYRFGTWQAAALLIGSALVSYVLFMAFVKFYRRFSLEALMALAVSYKRA